MNSFLTLNRLTHVLTIISIGFVIYFIGVECGETCRRKDVNGNDEVFECPRLFESSKKRFCCGFTAQDKHCCEWSKKSQDLIRNPADVKFLFEGAVAIIILVLLIIGGLIICCCVCACCLLSRKRQRRGHVLSQSRGEGTDVTTANSLQNSGAYPAPPNAYPMHAVTPPYPVNEQPPPYSYGQTQPPYNPSYPIK